MFKLPVDFEERVKQSWESLPAHCRPAMETWRSMFADALRRAAKQEAKASSDSWREARNGFTMEEWLESRESKRESFDPSLASLSDLARNLITCDFRGCAVKARVLLVLLGRLGATPTDELRAIVQKLA